MKHTTFAIIEIGSKQYLVKQNELLKVDRVTDDVSVNVLLAKVSDKLEIGEPYVNGVGVQIELLEDKKDKKVSIRRFKSKSRYRRNVGHRQPISLLKVTQIGKGIKSLVSYNKSKVTTKEDK